MVQLVLLEHQVKVLTILDIKQKQLLQLEIQALNI
jgi:hypothetical protein